MAWRAVALLSLGAWMIPACAGYSVLTHEAIIDAAWRDSIRPLLVERFPGVTHDELRKAHAYAYGGAIIQDMGYYPLGSRFFSDLAHYVRSGDFVLALLEESRDLYEYAFALGSLAHYAADNSGHPVATNRAVAILFPKLRRKFGRTVTYADDPSAHIKVEFSFDVVQVAEGYYAPEAYHDFIGFEVSRPLLERTFQTTYSLEMPSIFRDEELAIGTYRRTVSSLIPSMTKVAWQMRKDDIKKTESNATRRRFVYNVSQSSYRTRWGKVYEKPGLGARFVAFLLRLVPKVGPFQALAFRPPTPEVETMFMRSFNHTLDRYRCLLIEHGEGTLRLANDNFDTGEPIKPGAYTLADAAYAKLVDKVNTKTISEELRANILAFYADLNAPFATRRDPKSWARLLHELDSLKVPRESDPQKIP